MSTFDLYGDFIERMIHVLLAAGVQIDAVKSSLVTTPSQGHINCVAYLLKGTMDPTVGYLIDLRKYNDPLQVEAAFGNVRICEIWLERGEIGKNPRLLMRALHAAQVCSRSNTMALIMWKIWLLHRRKVKEKHREKRCSWESMRRALIWADS